jgi:hypothetical protein
MARWHWEARIRQSLLSDLLEHVVNGETREGSQRTRLQGREEPDMSARIVRHTCTADMLHIMAVEAGPI